MPNGLAQRCVLLTGATGVVGSALVPQFLEDPTTEVHLLLRADTPSHLEQRLLTLWEEWQLADGNRRRQQVRAWPGDVCQPGWGLSHAAYQQLVSRVTHVIHAAGNVKLNQSLDEARQTAVGGVCQTLEFVRACQAHGQFRKLDVVSTVGVAGKTPGRLPERPSAATRWHNTYEQAKAEAEQLVLAEMGQGLPATIHRPSMVVGDSRTGRVRRFQVFYYLSDFLLGLRTWGLVPDTGTARLDIIPVDYVAGAIHAASTREIAVGKILHLCSGPERSRLLSELTVQLQAHLARRGRRPARLRHLSPGWFRRALQLIQPLLPARRRRFLQTLPFFLDYLDEVQSFDTTETDQLLAGDGWPPPPPEQYLERIMSTYWYQQEHP